MPIQVAITGGIACGKSSVSKRLNKRLCGESEDAHFDSDEAVSKLLTEARIARQLEKRVGSRILDPDGKVDRSQLSDILFEDSVIRKRVEDFLHPLVLELAESFLDDRNTSRFAFLEVPLLYEVDFPLPRDLDLVVGCSTHTQIKRLREKRGKSQDQAEKILEAQLPIQEKVDRADYVIWNDGSRESFDQQTEKIAQRILLDNPKPDHDRKG